VVDDFDRDSLKLEVGAGLDRDSLGGTVERPLELPNHVVGGRPGAADATAPRSQAVFGARIACSLRNSSRFMADRLL
jgi:hypothetical protein